MSATRGFDQTRLQIVEDDMPFRAVFFIDSRSGLTLLSKTFGPRRYNEDLISGLFQALDGFIRVLDFGEDDGTDLQEIVVRNGKILYHRNKNIMAVGITQGPETGRERGVLQEFTSRFCEEYEQQLTNFSGNVSVFQGFAPNLGIKEVAKAMMAPMTPIPQPPLRPPQNLMPVSLHYNTSGHE
jgi:hypothetical protein